ncbi:MAG TPA: S-layer homology domain-containing protein [Acidimicrobiia bacterium]|nr:S-layer homology domain-containing protein [Acidimicrobiia bacterium]
MRSRYAYVGDAMRRLNGFWWSVTVLCAVLVPASSAVADVWLDEDFTDGPEVFTRVVQDMEPLGDGHTGPGARSIIPKGGHWGSSGHWEFSEHGIADPEVLYWRYFIRFPDGFYIEPRNRGKLPGPANLYTYNCLGNRGTTPAEPCWSARMLFSRDYAGLADPDPNGPSDKTLLGFYVYHLDSPSNRGDIWVWDDEVALLDHGRWYCVEGKIELNTPGSHDGSLQGWVDGQEAFSRDGIAFRRADEGHLDVDSFWFDVYYGGDTSAVRNEIHFDSLTLADERIGCADAAEGTFSDDDRSPHVNDIEALAAAGITRGCNPPANDRFCPDEPVTRGQMAAFLGRALGLASAPAAFSDVSGHVFEAEVGALAAAGITRGCDPPANDRFCPDEPVTRGQMASFLVRAGLAD